MISNKKLGNAFETELCEIFFQNGYWTHNMAQNASGQPADIIAVKNGKAILIDCKVCSDNKFHLSRVEDNQNLSMDFWRDCGNGEGWFALKTAEGTFMLSHTSAKRLAQTKTVINITEIKKWACPLEGWLNAK